MRTTQCTALVFAVLANEATEWARTVAILCAFAMLLASATDESKETAK